MIIADLIKHIENWAPKEAAWSKDNVGLQVGSLDYQLNNVLLSLDITPEVVTEAIQNNCNLIISHHPFLFHPIRQLNITKDKNSAIIETLIKNNITVYSAHTNLDFTKEGVSFQLAKQLNLKNISFLSNLSQNQFKLIVYVPESHLHLISEAVFNAGGGEIGEYTHCGFRTEGIGSFKGSPDSNPTVGDKGEYEKVKEIKFETLLYSWKLNEVITAVKQVHPYEEVAFDVYRVDSPNVNFGAGAIGELESPLATQDFLNYVADKLNIKNFRFTPGTGNVIKKVAVCGGSGINYLPYALNKADAYITGDIKYHDFLDHHNLILLVDAGHYETEIAVITELYERLVKIANNKHKILRFSGSTNPIIFFNN